MNNKVKSPNISESTMKEMASFFMKTSIPRIIAKNEKNLIELNPIRTSSAFVQRKV